MSLSVHATSNDGVVIVALAGWADAALLTRLQEPLGEGLGSARVHHSVAVHETIADAANHQHAAGR